MNDDERREYVIREVARLVVGLHVPISLGMPLGDASKAYSDLRDLIGDFGWSDTGEIEKRLHDVMDFA